jgi:hypothetical protein
MTRFQIALAAFALGVAVWFVFFARSFRSSFERRRNAPASGSGGLTLQPGESMNLPIPPELEAQLAGFAMQGAKITTRETAPVRGADGRYSQEMTVLVDGEPFAKFTVSFTQ